ncbi:MAG: dUTP diphosphatase [Candidatus Lokiarchaeota archaeon]|nr:dUTP diphosphatase [Candidatus Lokiarchaeota archaeon]
MKVFVKKWTNDSRLPERKHNDDAGFDCYIRGFKRPVIEEGTKKLIDINENSYILKPLERIGCPLGFATAVPNGYYAAVVPRSGNALWKGLTILNTPGTIDAGYRNEWMAIVVNVSNDNVKIEKGERICQFILRKLVDFDLETSDDLEESERNLGGFGSTD